MTKLIPTLLLSLMSIFTSCGEDYLSREVKQSLKLAGDNKVQLESVLEHYSTNDSDSLKLKAAKFLIANMKYYNCAKGAVVDDYNKFIDSVYKIEADVYLEKDYYDPFKENSPSYGSQPNYVPDVELMTADYLINNIEASFKVWKKPYASHLNFDDFAELILPYRIGNEPMEDWRNLYSNTFSHLLSDTIQCPINACRVINDSLIAYTIHTFQSSINPSTIRPSSLINIKFGICDDYASLAIYTMRSLGIPVAKDFIPLFGRRPNKHSFNMVQGNDGSTHDFSGSENNPDEHLMRFEPAPKIYRQTFGVQDDALIFASNDEGTPKQLSSPFMKDVTSEYEFMNPQNIEVDFNKKDVKIAYLCVFDINGWYPVGWSKPNGGKVSFKGVGPNIIYCAGYYSDNKTTPVGYPFLVNESGDVEYHIPNMDLLETAKFKRKYPTANNLSAVPQSVVGSEFHGSNSPSFNTYDVLHKITNAHQFEYITVQSESANKYKYLRYMSSDKSKINIAELEFYAIGEDTPIEGKAIGTKDKSPYYPESELEHAFDNQPLTFVFTAKTKSWVGLSLSSAKPVESMRYLIRNGDNGIRKGQNYELFYADENQWVSLGQKEAPQDNFIEYNNVPQGALYWLRNLTLGKEERIFILRDGEQKWF